MFRVVYNCCSWFVVRCSWCVVCRLFCVVCCVSLCCWLHDVGCMLIVDASRCLLLCVVVCCCVLPRLSLFVVGCCLWFAALGVACCLL